MKYNLADYSVYEFYKAGAGDLLGQGRRHCSSQAGFSKFRANQLHGRVGRQGSKSR